MINDYRYHLVEQSYISLGLNKKLFWILDLVGMQNDEICYWIFFNENNYTNPGYGLSLVDTLWNAGSYGQPLEQEGNPMT